MTVGKFSKRANGTELQLFCFDSYEAVKLGNVDINLLVEGTANLERTLLEVDTQSVKTKRWLEPVCARQRRCHRQAQQLDRQSHQRQAAIEIADNLKPILRTKLEANAAQVQRSKVFLDIKPVNAVLACGQGCVSFLRLKLASAFINFHR